MSVLSLLKPATLAVTVVAAGSLLGTAPVQAQVTVLRGSPSLPTPPYFSNQNNNQDNRSSTYSPSSYDDNYPYYGGDFPLGVGDLGHGFHRGDFPHRGFPTGGFHAGFHGGGFHGGGFGGGGFHGGGGHR